MSQVFKQVLTRSFIKMWRSSLLYGLTHLPHYIQCEIVVCHCQRKHQVLIRNGRYATMTASNKSTKFNLTTLEADSLGHDISPSKPVGNGYKLRRRHINTGNCGGWTQLFAVAGNFLSGYARILWTASCPSPFFVLSLPDLNSTNTTSLYV